MRKIRVFALIIALIMMLPLCACGDAAGDDAAVSPGDVSPTDVSPTDAADDWYSALSEEERALADVVLSNTDAFNAKDEAAYMETIDPESEARSETLEYVRMLFDEEKKYFLTAAIEDIEIVEFRDDTAVLRVTQTTVRNDEGKAFADVRTVLIHTMVYRDAWYISSTVVESRTELDSNWDIASDYLAGQNASGSDAPVTE